MKKLILSLACTFALGTAAFAQSQSISLYTSGSMSQTSGSFTPGSTLSLDVYVTFTGFTMNGLSFWLQTQSGLAPFITITNEQYFTFTDPNDGPLGAGTFNNKAFNSGSGANTGMLTDSDVTANPQTGTLTGGDLGATGVGQTAGTYKVATITFTLSGASNGSFNLSTTTLSPKTSVATDTNFAGHAFSAASYGVTIVPEPSTVACFAFGLGLLGVTVLRRRARNA